MGLIQDAIRKWKEKKEEKKKMEDTQRWQDQIEKRKISTNEIELMRYQEEDRQAMIKKLVQERRQQEKRDMWSGRKDNPIDIPNIVKDSTNMFNGKSIFMGKSNLFSK